MAELQELARKLGFQAIDANWSEYAEEPWLKNLLEAERKERETRGLEKRIKDAEIGQFKPMTQFEWDWPKQVDRMQIEDLFSLEFLEKPENIVLIGTNGLGKTMIAQNLAYQAVMTGHSALFVKASKMLAALVQAGNSRRKQMLRRLCRVGLLCVDEVGYMSYSNEYADLLYEVIAGRYEQRATIVTTNKVFKHWGQIFPNAACVVALVDHLVHHSEIITMTGLSWRHHEAEKLAAEKERARQTKAASRKQKTR